MESYENFRKERILDFDYKEFDKTKYLNISPFNSPSTLSLNKSFDEESSFSESETLSGNIETLSDQSEISLISNNNLETEDKNKENISLKSRVS